MADPNENQRLIFELQGEVERLRNSIPINVEIESVQIFKLSPIEPDIIGDIRPNRIIICYCDATETPFTVDLPDASEVSTNIFSFPKTDPSNNAITLQAQFDQLIVGSLTLINNVQFNAPKIGSDGSNFFLL